MRPEGQDNRPLADSAADGDRLVFYEYCISLIFLSLRRPTPVRRLRPGQRGWIAGLPYSVLSLLLGWWCIPWGFIYTPLVLWTNFRGGRTLTAQERQRYERHTDCTL